ncbi:MAG TPA: YiiX/YebB-like N1pC/P60 family cysteine hydrolase [Hanamia sp.]
MRIHPSLIFIKRWQWCCLLFFIQACHSLKKEHNFHDAKKDSLSEEIKINNALQLINEAKKMVHSADLILRTGKDFTSDAMRKLSKYDKTYSHCGIASWENDTLFVYHALGGDFNPDQKIRRDPFYLFCNPYENRGFGIFRYKLNKNQQRNTLHFARDYFSKGIMFDMQFNLATDDRMYCSEYVYKIIKKATAGVIPIHTTTLNKIVFVAVDNLFINPYCSEIQRTIFR